MTPLGVEAELFARAADAGASHPLRRELRLRSDVLFCPANTWPHKNHERLLQALAVLRDANGLRPSLVLTGSAKHGHRAVMAGVERLGLNDQGHWLGYVDAARVVGLYHAATALVFPSLHEGFGMPILEAMAAGCPVACSRTTASGETAGDAALTFDPEDVADIAGALRALLRSEQLRQDLARRGLERAARFTWERTARATLRVYEGVVSSVFRPASRHR